jgi:DNA-binding XRE family transcriptional regulator
MKKTNLISVSGKINSGKDTVGQIIQYLTLDDSFSKSTKDVIADLEHNSYCATRSNWQIKKFADKLKDMVCLLLGCTREDLEDREFKNKVLGEEWWRYRYKVHELVIDVIGKYPNDKFVTIKDEKGFPIREFVIDKKTGNYIYKYFDKVIYDMMSNEDKEFHNVEVIKMTPRKLMQLLGTDAGRNIIHPDIWCNSLFSDYNGDIEKWVDIKGYESLYQISSFGNVRSLDREIIYGDKNKGEYHNRKGQLLKPSLSNGYKTISLSGVTHTIHSLVAKHFLNEPLNKDYVVNHIDYNKENNFYKNLEWVTQKDNVRHNYLTGNANIGVKQKDAKLDKDKVLQIKFYLKEGILSQAKIAKMYNVSATTITDIKKGRKWKHIDKEVKNIQPILPKPTPQWIITDTRFPNEVEAVKQRGGINIRINRKQNNYYLPLEYYEGLHENNMLNGNIETIRKYFHPSETALDNYQDWDYVIDNSGSLEDLIEEVRKILIDLKIIE